MAFVAPKNLLHWLRHGGRHSHKGFTLLELLIAIIIGSLITTTLLYLVIEMLKVNGREEALTQTQQNMRRAADYITRDLSEAIYVYDSPESEVGSETNREPLIDKLSDLPVGATPILAFWRVDPIDEEDIDDIPDCTTFAAGDPREECRTLKTRRVTYTLVVYLQEENDDDGIWGGSSRIIRYQLPKYEDLASLTQTPGYTDPSLTNLDGDSANARGYDDWEDSGATDGIAQVLTDEVFKEEEDTTPGTCPDDTGGFGDYSVYPPNSNTFYICTRNRLGGDGTDDEQITNQSVVVYLQGDPEGREDRPIFSPASNNSLLPTIRSEALIRGIIEEEPPE